MRTAARRAEYIDSIGGIQQIVITKTPELATLLRELLGCSPGSGRGHLLTDGGSEMMGTMHSIAGINALNGKLQHSLGWGGRGETAESVAARLLESLRAVERIDGSSIDGWVDGKTNLPLKLRNLTEYVRDEVFRDEVGKTLPDHGFDFRVVRPSSSSRPALDLAIAAGSQHGVKPGVWVNSVETRFMGERGLALQYFSNHATELLEALVTVWTPDFGYAGTTQQVLATAPERFGTPPIAAVTWLSHQFSMPVSVAGAEVKAFQGGHTIFLGSAAMADSSVEAAVEAYRSLAAHGLSVAAATQP